MKAETGQPTTTSLLRTNFEIMTLSKRHFVILTMLIAAAVSAGAAPAHPIFARQEAEHAVIPDEGREAHAAGQDTVEHAASQEAEDHATDQEHGEEAETLDPVHHNADAHYIDFSPLPKLELPRIFVVRRADGALGLDAFLSTTSALESGAYQAHMTEDVHSVLDAEIAVSSGEIVLDLSLTKHLIFAWIGALIVLIIFIRLARMYARGPGRETAPKGIFQNLFESLVMFVRDDIARPILGNKAAKYLPYLLTAFFFILTCNLLGLVPFGATATSNIMVTAVLATFTFVITQFGGTKDYWRHIFWPPGAPVFVKLILIPVEILGIFTKPFALAIRLFANMTAGHLVILSLIGLIFAFGNLFGAVAGYGVAPVSVAFAVFINLLEILVAMIQAYVFTMLSALFIGMAVEEHHHEGHAEAAEASDHRRPERDPETTTEPAVA